MDHLFPLQRPAIHQQNMKNGFSFCTACGDPVIPPSEKWKVKCSACFEMRMEAKFCRHCGDPLESSRIKYAKKQGGECLQCYYCSKGCPKA